MSPRAEECLGGKGANWRKENEADQCIGWDKGKSGERARGGEGSCPASLSIRSDRSASGKVRIGVD